MKSHRDRIIAQKTRWRASEGTHLRVLYLESCQQEVKDAGEKH